MAFDQRPAANPAVLGAQDRGASGPADPCHRLKTLERGPGLGYMAERDAPVQAASAPFLWYR
jgi:hypothetical protein